MKEVLYYVADDGKKFEDEDACREYELNLKVRSSSGLIMFTDDFELTKHFDESTYLVVRNGDGCDLLDELCDSYGFIAPWGFKENDRKPGIYVYKYETDEWYDLEKKVRKLNDLLSDIDFHVGNLGYETLFD